MTPRGAFETADFAFALYFVSLGTGKQYLGADGIAVVSNVAETEIVYSWAGVG